eukprot:jgi/Phyca11/109101/e_gw1.16.371.1
MAPTPIVPGTLAFQGPAHIPGLAEFRYVRVSTVQGDKVKVALVSVNEEEEAIAEEVDISIIKRRRVNDEEGELWPGLFVGHPIAFVQPEGVSMDEWAVGVVTGYHMGERNPWLHVRCADRPTKVKLDQPPNVIKIDWVNYVLQTGTGTNVAAMNAEELVMLMDKVTRKSTTQDDARPATRRKTQEAKDNSAPEAISAVELSPDVEEYDDKADIKAVRLQNRAFEDGLGVDDTDGAGANAPIGGTVVKMAPFYAGDEGRGRAATTFRPTAIEQGIHNAIGHPDHQGKDGQCILECAQQARGTRFQATPPVLRGAFDFGFYIRGLSLMHFTSIPRRSTLGMAANTVNMTDFSRKNALLPVTTEPVYTGLTDALSNPCQFGRRFYNDKTVSVLRAVATFVEDFADGSEPDQDTTICLVQWIDRKLGKFRGLVVSDGLTQPQQST